VTRRPSIPVFLDSWVTWYYSVCWLPSNIIDHSVCSHIIHFIHSLCCAFPFICCLLLVTVHSTIVPMHIHCYSICHSFWLLLFVVPCCSICSDTFDDDIHISFCCYSTIHLFIDDWVHSADTCYDTLITPDWGVWDIGDVVRAFIVPTCPISSFLEIWEIYWWVGDLGLGRSHRAGAIPILLQWKSHICLCWRWTFWLSFCSQQSRTLWVSDWNSVHCFIVRLWDEAPGSEEGRGGRLQPGLCSPGQPASDSVSDLRKCPGRLGLRCLGLELHSQDVGCATTATMVEFWEEGWETCYVGYITCPGIHSTWRWLFISWLMKFLYLSFTYSTYCLTLISRTYTTISTFPTWMGHCDYRLMPHCSGTFTLRLHDAMMEVLCSVVTLGGVFYGRGAFSVTSGGWFPLPVNYFLMPFLWSVLQIIPVMDSVHWSIVLILHCSVYIVVPFTDDADGHWLYSMIYIDCMIHVSPLLTPFVDHSVIRYSLSIPFIILPITIQRADLPALFYWWLHSFWPLLMHFTDIFYHWWLVFDGLLFLSNLFSVRCIPFYYRWWVGITTCSILTMTLWRLQYITVPEVRHFHVFQWYILLGICCPTITTCFVSNLTIYHSSSLYGDLLIPFVCCSPDMVHLCIHSSACYHYGDDAFSPLGNYYLLQCCSECILTILFVLFIFVCCSPVWHSLFIDCCFCGQLSVASWPAVYYSLAIIRDYWLLAFYSHYYLWLAGCAPVCLWPMALFDTTLLSLRYIHTIVFDASWWMFTCWKSTIVITNYC